MVMRCMSFMVARDVGKERDAPSMFSDLWGGPERLVCNSRAEQHDHFNAARGPAIILPNIKL